MNIKKTLAGVASYALVGAVALGIGGTLATYTDSDSDVNTATVGGVSIVQYEYQREDNTVATNEIGEGETNLVPFVQNQALYPAYAEEGGWTANGYGTNENLYYWNEYVHTGTAGNGLWDPEKLKGAMDKFVFVKNTGKSDCYFRTIIAFECPEGITVGDAGNGATVGMNVNGSTIWDDDFVDYITIDDVRYKMYEFIYTDILHPKEQAHPSLLQVAFSDKMTNEEAELLGDTYEILVFSQACQVENLPTNDGVATASAEDVKSNAEMALDTAFYDVDKDHHPWVDGIKIGYEVSSDTELAAAIAAGETEIWLNAGTYHAPSAAKGKTLTLNGTEKSILEIVPAGQGEAGGQLDYNFDGSTVTFNGITIKTNSQLYAGYARMSGTYNDCVIQNTYNLGANTVNAFNNCEINISNEYLRVGGAASAEFNNCTFNTDGRAILVFQDGTHVAQTVTVKDCTFNATAAAKTWNGIPVAAVSIDGTNGTYTVNLEGNNTVDSDFNGLWQIKTGEANVTVNE